ncbi:MAG TPA: tryptophan synthase subunit alpha [Thermoanaerobaculia bacterium]|nr:tryptophan synthase subunit alpha [Thermoanaerobaculia bacterium]
MKRLDRMFRRLRNDRRCGLIAYVTCGDPDRETTVRIAETVEEAGACAIELGVPFSDPIADGPVIQAASQRALAAGTTIEDLFTIARSIRSRSSIPLVAFSYFNPVLRYGTERFAESAAAAGIDSLLLTDLPAEAAGDVRKVLRRRGLGMIFLLAPTSTAARVRLADRMSDGFVYYVSTNGVTGERRELDRALLGRLEQVRTSVRLPLAVGFGISEAKHYEELKGRCDAVVVGSAIVRAIGDGDAGEAPARAAAVVRRILGERGEGSPK